MSIVEVVRKYVGEGWNIRIRKRKNGIYVSARKSIGGKLVEKGLGYALSLIHI